MNDDGSRRETKLTRRGLLAASLAGGGLLAARRLLGEETLAALDARSAPGTTGLVVRNERPLDAETSLDALEPWITPRDSFFVRSHFGPPSSMPSSWSLAIDGEVGAPLEMSVAELRRLPSETRRVTLECAGNGRGLMSLPTTSGIQWEYGAVSTAEWTGVPLGALLDRAKLAPAAQHLWVEGTDRAPGGKAPPFLRSIPLAKGRDRALVAWAMNGVPIPLLNGGPLRLIVPGWFGMASTKWLKAIHARANESDNHFQVRGYRYGDGSPVQRMLVKSVIVTPTAGARLKAGRLSVKGKAWSGAGAGGIRSVELSADGGSSWETAQLVGRDEPDAWRSWEASVQLAAGRHSLLARATDRTGETQPRTAKGNPAGYGNNGMHEVTIDVTP